jgi:hypothetical protein
MTFNELQKNYWQKDTTVAKLTIDSNLLLREVMRNKKLFESIILSRDIREVAAGILGILFCLGFTVFFFYKGLNVVAWVLAISILFDLWVVMFFIADRIFQRKKRPSRGESLTVCVEDSLTQVNHQIWLLKNMLWWYLLPPGIGMTAFFVTVYWQIRAVGESAIIQLFINLALVTLVFWGAYWLNQYAVRKELIPRKKELEAMLKNLANGDNAMPS